MTGYNGADIAAAMRICHAVMAFHNSSPAFPECNGIVAAATKFKADKIDLPAFLSFVNRIPLNIAK